MKRHILLIVVIIFIAYANSLLGDFIYDDFCVIYENDFVKSWKNFPLLFNRAYLSHPMEMAFNVGAYNIGACEATYRPIATISYFLNYSLFKLHAWGYRLTNILLHIVNVILVYMLLNLMFNNDRFSFFSAMLFGIHPVNAEVLNCTAFRPNILAFLFSLSSIILYFRYKTAAVRHRWTILLLSLISFLLAVLSKEVSLILPLILVICDAFYEDSGLIKILRGNKAYLLYLLLAASYIFIYLCVFSPQQRIAKVAVSYGELFYNFITMLNALGIYLKDILFPKDLVIILGQISVGYLEVILAVIVILVSVYIILKKRKTQREISFAISWFFIWFFPMNNFIYSTRIYLAYRYLYIAMLGFSLLLGFLLVKIWDIHSRLLPHMLILRRVLVFSCFIYFLIFTVSGNVIWKNDVVLFSTACERYPASVTAHSGLGVALLRYGNTEEANKEFNAVLSLSRDPHIFKPYSFVIASIYLARSYNEKKQYAEAEKMYLQALEVFPNSARVNTELGIYYSQRGLYEKALYYFNKAKKINPDFTPAYIRSGIVYKLMGKYSEAKNELLRALEIYPESREAREGLVELETVTQE